MSRGNKFLGVLVAMVHWTLALSMVPTGGVVTDSVVNPARAPHAAIQGAGGDNGAGVDPDG